jgi:DNA-binding GntR family transcriptional regulator
MRLKYGNGNFKGKRIRSAARTDFKRGKKPGEYMTERYLVELLQMSRTPIRSALERLEVEGLVVYSPKKGLSIAELSLQRIVDFFDFRIALEGYIVRKLAGRSWSEEEKAWFQANLDTQALCVETNNYSEFTKKDSEFHRKLAGIYDNQEIVQTMENLQDKLYQIALKVLRKDNSRIEKSYQDHKNIIESIIRGNADEAEQLMVEHLEFGKRILIL